MRRKLDRAGRRQPIRALTAITLLLSHKHPDDRHYVSQTLDAIRTSGGPFSSRHRIVDTKGVTRSVILVGDSIEGEHREVTGSAGFYIDVVETLDRTVKESVDELVDAISSSRAAIEQAKGMLMIVYGISAERAYDILIWCSQLQNVKLRRISEQLLARARADFVLPNGRVRNSTITFSAPQKPIRSDERRLRLLFNRRHLAEGPPPRRRCETIYIARTDQETPRRWNRNDR